MQTTNTRGYLILTNKETGEERVYVYADFERLADLFSLLDTPIGGLLGAQCSSTYRDRLIAVKATTYKWTARAVCEELYRKENALPPTAEEEEARRAEEDYHRAKKVYGRAREDYHRTEAAYVEAEAAYVEAKAAYNETKKAYNWAEEDYEEAEETYHRAEAAFKKAKAIDPTQVFSTDSDSKEE